MPNTLDEYLRDPAAAADYLNAALEADEPGVALLALRNAAEAQEGGVDGLAERAGLDPSALRRLLSAPESATLAGFARAVRGLGLRLAVRAR